MQDKPSSPEQSSTPSSEMHPPACRFAPGALVRRRSNTARSGQVMEASWHAGLNTWMVKVKQGTSLQSLPEFELESLPTAGPDHWKDLLNGYTLSPIALRQLVTHDRLAHLAHPLGERFVPAHARLLPEQYLPLLKLLEAPSPRLLITDAEGSGRSVAMGYVLRDFLMRRQARQVLIFTPLADRPRRVGELRRRFGLPLSVLSAQQFRTHLLSVRRGWELPPMCAVVALESLTTFDVPELLERYKAAIDLTIVDGAEQVLSQGPVVEGADSPTISPLMRAVSALSSATDGLLLVTSQPLKTCPEELFSLLQLLHASDVQRYDLVSFMSTALVHARLISSLDSYLSSPSEAGHEQLMSTLEMFRDHPLHSGFQTDALFQHVQQALSTPLPAEEAVPLAQKAALLRAVESLHPIATRMTHTERSSHRGGQSEVVPLVLPIPQSAEEPRLHAALETVIAELRPYAQNPAAKEMLPLPLQLLQQGPGHAVPLLQELQQAPGLWLDHPPEREIDAEREMLEPPPPVDLPESLLQRLLATLAPALDLPADVLQDMRMDTLIHTLTSLWAEDEAAGRPARKVVIYTAQLRPLRYLAQQLTMAGFETRLLAGVLPLDEQRIRVHQWSTDPALKVLVTTDRGGAGLDLHAAEIIVHYELPWQPLLLARRLARVKRPGQLAPRLLQLFPVTENSVESRVLLPLYEKLGLLHEPGRVLEGALEGQTVEDLLLSPTTEPALDALIEQGLARVVAHRQALAQSRDLFPRDLGLRQLLAALETPVEGPLSVQGWLSGAAQRTFFIQQVASAWPGVRLTGDPVSDVGQLDLTPAAQKALVAFANNLPPGVKQHTQTLAHRAAQGPFPVSWHPDKALLHPECELLQPGHPLLRFATSVFEPHIPHHGRTFHLALKSGAEQALPSGVWLLGLWRLRTEGVKEGWIHLPLLVPVQPQETSLGLPDAASLLDWTLRQGEETDAPLPDLALREQAIVRLQAQLQIQVERLRTHVQSLEKSRLVRRRARAVVMAREREEEVQQEVVTLKQGHEQAEQLPLAQARLKARRVMREALEPLVRDATSATLWPTDLETRLVMLGWVHSIPSA